ncbi:maleylpyruvate isomerase family mycothiol-dependent enzyme [Microlunatus spumicola]|uniref:maleylpyruvate isomerase family mycothiol-dependent enzyme n=1 Tax=Microlunatus spumicola TaxID=81499 RepID=UPI0031D0B3F3
MSEPSPDARLAELRVLLTTATQRLLGSTIVVTDAEWALPSRLPGWSRAHVATHVARQADGFARLVEGAAAGERRAMYSSPEARTAEIEDGADRTGLELQTDLDTSAERLTEAFDRLDQLQVGQLQGGQGQGGQGTGDGPGTGWSAAVELRGGLVVPARLLPLGRLFEVELHHVDLDVGLDVEQIEPEVAEWLIEWVAFRARLRDEFPRVELHADSGFSTTVGQVGDGLVVHGTAPALVGWLTNRLEPDAVAGTRGLRLPSL